MIITTSKHGRTTQDCVTLNSHLLKKENKEIKILEIGNSVATDLHGVIQDMQLLRNGSKATCAFHHISINPNRDCTDAELLACVNLVRRELDPEGERPYVAIAHTKDRASSDAKRHAHLVLGHVNANGIALNDSYTKIRAETVARICEYNLGYMEPTLGRHHKSVLKILDQRGLNEIRRWLSGAHGESPERPRSAISAKTRQRAGRTGLNLPSAKFNVSELWRTAICIHDFERALRAHGFALSLGKKANVWIIVDQHGRLIGAADRITRLKRSEFRQLMEKPHEHIENFGFRTRTPHRGAREKALRPIEGNFGQANGIGTAPRSAGATEVRRGPGPDRPHGPPSRNLDGSLATADSPFGSDRRQTRFRARGFEHQRALIALRAVGSKLLASRAIEEFLERAPPMWEPRWNIWGLPIEPPKYGP